MADENKKKSTPNPQPWEEIHPPKSSSQDDQSNTDVQAQLLHALRYQDLNRAKDIMKNHEGSFSLLGKLIVTVPPASIEEVLDSHLTADGAVIDDDFRVNFDYSFLLPPNMKTQKCQKTTAGTSTRDTNNDIVMLDEPVDTSESQYKTDIDVMVPETQLLWHLSNSEEHRYLLKHPVLSSFLWLKWQCVRRYFYMNVFIQFIYVICLTLYSMGNFRIYPGLIPGLMAPYMWYAVVPLFVYLFLRELFEYLSIRNKYFFRLDNCLETLVITFSFILLFPYKAEEHEHFFRQISAVVMLLSWGSLVTLIGKHPKITTYSVLTYNTVLGRFTLVLLWYFPLIFAFAVSFTILFYKADYYPSLINFKTPGLALGKITDMFAGEVGYADFYFMYDLGYVVLLLYLFLINFVIQNLMNGIAIADVQFIHGKTEIYSLTSRVETIFHMETWLFWKLKVSRCMKDDGSSEADGCGRCCSFTCKPCISALTYFRKRVALIPRLPKFTAACYPNETKFLSKGRVPCSKPGEVSLKQDMTSIHRLNQTENLSYFRQLEVIFGDIFGLRMSDDILSVAKSRFLKIERNKKEKLAPEISLKAKRSLEKYNEVMAKIEKLEKTMGKIIRTVNSFSHKGDQKSER